jgi:hypothetical protein
MGLVIQSLKNGINDFLGQSYNPDSIERFSRYKRRLKSSCSIIESLLNQSYNIYSQDIIYIESYEEPIPL